MIEHDNASVTCNLPVGYAGGVSRLCAEALRPRFGFRFGEKRVASQSAGQPGLLGRSPAFRSYGQRVASFRSR
ncbi:MAG: hypothetical protein IPL78_18025 [Chloroflexi bacterium]|nr:hypothetical protein [Chloroflexota bacterium]